MSHLLVSLAIFQVLGCHTWPVVVLRKLYLEVSPLSSTGDCQQACLGPALNVTLVRCMQVSHLPYVYHNRSIPSHRNMEKVM